ncbi:MAG: 5-formyltetrahydrofolate cyclo-ligase [Anaplasmataceae bacterium]|nr:5-formyltetrahydrofolate cyclo-ligase [Anaplasmataceae bacterium]
MIDYNKNLIRIEFKRKRKNITTLYQDKIANVIIDQFKKALGLLEVNLDNIQSIGLYLPINGEINTQSLMNDLIYEGKIISFPKVISKTEMHFIEQNNDNNICNPQLYIVPLIAFDKYKNRLGFGGGYYDRLIQKSINKIFIGLAYSVQFYNKQLPINEFDQKLNCIVTEDKIIY